MSILIIIAGIVSLIYGLLNVFGFTKQDTSKDSETDKKLLSEKSRYFIGRYFAGFQFIIAGLGAIILGLVMYFN